MKKHFLPIITLTLFCLITLTGCKFLELDFLISDTSCNHIEVIDKSSNPTCTENGLTEGKHCTLCGEITLPQQPIAALGHNYIERITPPTCLEGGYTVHTCSVCSDSYIDSETTALGHSYVDNVTLSTCLEDGYTVHTCSVCSDSYIDSETTALGHSYVDNVTLPTCLEGGYTEHICSACSDSYIDTETSALGHSYVETLYATSCSAKGYTMHTCSGCNDFYNDNYIPKTAHRFNGENCIYCNQQQAIENITPNTDWYNNTATTFLLSTKEDLAGLASLVNSGEDFSDKTVFLINDVDFEWKEWIPIGTEEYPFKGTFDGKNHTISSLKINSQNSYVGLFGKISGMLCNFTIDNASIYSAPNTHYISIACGYLTAEIKNIYVDGYIDAPYSHYVGGIVGYTTVQLSNCSSTTEIVGFDYTGGIAGKIASNSAATISNLTNNGTISGQSYVGGIAGEWTYSNTSIFNLSNNLGNITGTHHVGGIIGSLNYSSSNLLTVRELDNTGNVTASEHTAGGLFGLVNGNTSSTISVCSSSAGVQGTYYVGGLIGYTVNVTLKDSSNDGSTISATGFIISGSESYAYLGGYVGYGYAVSNCINNVDLEYNFLGERIGGIIGYATYNISDCTNNGNITSLAGRVGGIAGEVNSNQLLSCKNLANNGNIQSSGNAVGGIIGKLYNVTNTKGTYYYQESSNTWHVGYHYYSTSKLTSLANYGNISGQTNTAGLIGYTYFESTYYLKVTGCPNYHYHGHLGMLGTDFINNGEVAGTGNIGELLGYFKSDYSSTLNTYSILDHITKGDQLLEGEYPVGERYELTLSNKVIPAEENPEE